MKLLDCFKCAVYVRSFYISVLVWLQVHINTQNDKRQVLSFAYMQLYFIYVLSSISTSLYCLYQVYMLIQCNKENYFNAHQKLWEEKLKKLKICILLCLYHHHHPSPIVLKVISLIRFPGKQMHETKYGCRKSPVECSWDKTLFGEERESGWMEWKRVAM